MNTAQIVFCLALLVAANILAVVLPHRFIYSEFSAIWAAAVWFADALLLICAAVWLFMTAFNHLGALT